LSFSSVFLFLDLNSEELIAKRKNVDRIKQFSKQLREFNKDVMQQQPKLPSAVEQNDIEISKKKFDSNRIRAMEYARQVPKPKLNKGERISRSAEGHSQFASDLFMDEDAFQAAKLQELEAKHQQGKARLEAIKKSIGGR
jgi:hypothetical protein